MAQVQLADGEVLEFPDDMSPEVMDSTVKRHVTEKRNNLQTKAGEMAAEGMGPLGKMAVGAGSGIQSILESVGADKLSRMVSGGDLQKETANYRKGLGNWGKAGELASEVGLSMIPATKAAQAARWAIPALARSPAALMAIEGAVGGGLTSPDHQGVGAATGAVMGPVLGKALQAGGKIFSKPVPQSAVAEEARKAGINMSAGQGADINTMPGAVWSSAEKAAAKLPILGRTLANARNAGTESWRNVVMDKVLPPGMKMPSGNREEVFDAIMKQYKAAYDDALVGKRIVPDETFENFVTNAINDPSKFVNAGDRKYLNAQVDKNITEHIRNPAPEVAPTAPPSGSPTGAPALPEGAGPARLPPPSEPGTAVGELLPPSNRPMKDVGDFPDPTPAPRAYIDADTLFEGQKALRKEAFRFKPSDPRYQDVGGTLRDVADEVYNLIGRNDSTAGAALDALKPQAHNWGLLKEAIAASKKKSGTYDFTPKQLAEASGELSGTIPELAHLGQQLVQPASTRGNQLLPYIATGGLGALSHLGGPLGYAMLGLGAGAGTKSGQKLLMGNTSTQKMLAELLKKNPTLGSVLGANASADFTAPPERY